MGGLGRCTSAKATYKLKDIVTSVFRAKRKVPYAAEATGGKELDRLEKNITVFSKTNDSEW